MNANIAMVFGAYRHEKRTIIIPVVVTSLGITYAKSMQLLKTILKLDDDEMKRLKKRLSVTALKGSYEIWRNYMINKDEGHEEDRRQEEQEEQEFLEELAEEINEEEEEEFEEPPMDMEDHSVHIHADDDNEENEDETPIAEEFRGLFRDETESTDPEEV